MNPRTAAAIRGWYSRKREPIRTCTYRGCKRKHAAYGLCHKHYMWMRRGRLKVDALDNAARTGHSLDGFASQAVDRACAVCGAPTGWGACVVCDSVCLVPSVR